jgi:4-aminobutyrate aminotransferase-like enzyme
MNDRPDDETPKPLRSRAQSSYDASMEARVAVLEEIARNTEKLLERMDARMERMEDRMTKMSEQHSTDIRWLLALGMAATGLICAVMGHGFHWF